MSKRGQSEGTIYRRKTDGRWVAAISIGHGVGGRGRKYFYAKTRAEANKQLKDAQRAQDEGRPQPQGRETTEHFLREWLESIKSSVRRRTYIRYEQLLRVHAFPAIGAVPLNRLAPNDLQRLYADCLESGSAPQTVRNLHNVLHRAFGQAAKWGSAARNVADLVDAPKPAKAEMDFLTRDEVIRFLAAADGDRLYALFVLAVTSGMRQGELLALSWKHVDLDAGKINIAATLQRTPEGLVFTPPKTARSRRQISVAASGSKALRRHRVAQNEERLQAGTSWDSSFDLVFPNRIGKPIDARALVHHSHIPILEKAGLRPLRFHSLRHTAATLALRQNVHPSKVSAMLGHSSVGMTLDVYSHILPDFQEEAAAAIDAALAQ